MGEGGKEGGGWGNVAVAAAEGDNDALNLTLRALGSIEARGSRVVLICIPWARALAGR